VPPDPSASGPTQISNSTRPGGASIQAEARQRLEQIGQKNRAERIAEAAVQKAGCVEYGDGPVPERGVMHPERLCNPCADEIRAEYTCPDCGMTLGVGNLDCSSHQARAKRTPNRRGEAGRISVLRYAQARDAALAGWDGNGEPPGADRAVWEPRKEAAGDVDREQAARRLE
jgi:hypothetical protein